MSFKPGDKVVCVDDSPRKGSNRCCFLRRLRLNAVYVVSDIAFDDSGDLGVWLVGFPPAPKHFDGRPIYFKAYRFRLVSEVGHPPIAAMLTAAPEFESEKQRKN